jgi:hypothetical protein
MFITLINGFIRSLGVIIGDSRVLFSIPHPFLKVFFDVFTALLAEKSD